MFNKPENIEAGLAKWFNSIAPGSLNKKELKLLKDKYDDNREIIFEMDDIHLHALNTQLGEKNSLKAVIKKELIYRNLKKQCDELKKDLDNIGVGIDNLKKELNNFNKRIVKKTNKYVFTEEIKQAEVSPIATSHNINF